MRNPSFLLDVAAKLKRHTGKPAGLVYDEALQAGELEIFRV